MQIVKFASWRYALCRTTLAFGAMAFVGACDLAGNQANGFESRINVASQMVATGQHDNAIRLLTHISEDHPTSAGASLSVGDVYLQAGSTRLAEAAYREVIKSGDVANGTLGLARVSLARNDPANARKFYNSVLAEDPENLIALNGLGVASDLEGKHDDARLIYRRVLEKDPVNARTLNNLALSHAIGGQAHIGVDILQEMIRSNYDDLTVRHNLAIAYHAAGQRSAAQELASVDLSAAEAKRMFELTRLYRRTK